MFPLGIQSEPIYLMWFGNNMERKEPPKVVVASQFIKQKSAITLNGQVIRNTPENPRVVEEYFKSLRKR